MVETPNIVLGNMPKDGGNLIVEAEAYDEFNSCYLIRPYLKKLVGATELLYNQPRYCLWLKDAPDQVLLHPLVKRRLGKLFKSTLNNRLHRNLACVIDKSSRDAKLKRAFEELPIFLGSSRKSVERGLDF